MMLVSTILLRLAVSLLPTTQQARFLDEWRTEITAVHRELGAGPGVLFSAQLVAAAPRITLEMRADSESGYAELSIAMLVSILPSVVLAGLGIYTGMWIMVAAELAIVVGCVLAASGFWSFEGRLLDSQRARFGLALAVAGSIVEVAVRRLTGFGPPIDAGVSANIPHAMIMAGMIFLVGSSYAGRLRSRMQLVAVFLLAPGAALNMVVTIINGASLNGFDRFGVLMYTIPSAAVAWACYRILGRRQVFAGARVLKS